MEPHYKQLRFSHRGSEGNSLLSDDVKEGMYSSFSSSCSSKTLPNSQLVEMRRDMQKSRGSQYVLGEQEVSTKLTARLVIPARWLPKSISFEIEIKVELGEC